ncbi:MAG TPA: NnrS family protein, partial [Sphingomicrobium sp.]|nr:NnrS family protein [Sphingomicrobium sp.]
MITRGQQMLALRRRRMAAALPFLRGGFRPFFFGGAAWGLIALTLWILALVGAVSLPTMFDPLAWHRHEMLFGFVGAVIAGFLLTAIPNWTGRLPIAGPPLAALAGLWLAARLAVLFSAKIGMFEAAVLDIGFYLVLAFVGAREVLAAKNRNLPIVGVVLLFAAANALDHIGAAGLMANADLGWMLGLSLVILLISLIGGRITPSFTRNWMAKQGMAGRLPTQPGRFDLLVIGITALALLFWVSGPAGLVAGGLLVAAALLQAVRLARWGGFRTIRDPLVAVLHVGYAWVPIGLALLGLSLA